MRKNSADRVIIFRPESNQVFIENVVDTTNQVVETKTGVYALQDAKTYIDAEKGSLVHIFNVSLPAAVEAETLKNLRRSVALRNMFHFDRATSTIDFAKVLPYIVIALLIVFK